VSVRDHRREFDESFARPYETPEPRTGLLAVEIAGTRYAVLLDDIQSVAPAGIITAVPSSRPELVGVASQRGRILAVFDLGALLGHPRGAPPAWLVIARGQPIAHELVINKSSTGRSH